MRPALLHKPNDRVRSIGFPKSDATSVIAAPATSIARVGTHPNPNTTPKLDHSRKGRWFVTFVIVSLMGFVAVSAWNAFFRFQAYGQLQGTIVRLSSSANGTVRAIHVREGELVEAGQLLVELDVPELEFQRQQASRHLQVAISDLQIRLADLASRNREQQTAEVDRRVRYYELLGQLHQREAELEHHQNTYRNIQKLKRQDAIANSEFIASKTSAEGSQSLVDDLTAAIRVLESTDEQLPPVACMDGLLRAEKSRIAELQSQLKSIDVLLHEKIIRAPVAGRILKRLAQAGEQVPANTPILELVESGTVEAVVYLPQRKASTLAIGDEIRLVVTPLGTLESFRIVRFAPEVIMPPESIKANYRAFKGLIRVYARPLAASNGVEQTWDLTSWVGAELCLPSLGYRGGGGIDRSECAPCETASSAAITEDPNTMKHIADRISGQIQDPVTPGGN